MVAKNSAVVISINITKWMYDLREFITFVDG